MGFGDNFEHRAHNATAAPLCHNTWRHVQEGRMVMPFGALMLVSEHQFLAYTDV